MEFLITKIAYFFFMKHQSINKKFNREAQKVYKLGHLDKTGLHPSLDFPS